MSGRAEAGRCCGLAAAGIEMVRSRERDKRAGYEGWQKAWGTAPATAWPGPHQLRRASLAPAATSVVLSCLADLEPRVFPTTERRVLNPRPRPCLPAHGETFGSYS